MVLELLPETFTGLISVVHYNTQQLTWIIMVLELPPVTFTGVISVVQYNIQYTTTFLDHHGP